MWHKNETFLQISLNKNSTLAKAHRTGGRIQPRSSLIHFACIGVAPLEPARTVGEATPMQVKLIKLDLDTALIFYITLKAAACIPTIADLKQRANKIRLLITGLFPFGNSQEYCIACVEIVAYLF